MIVRKFAPIFRMIISIAPKQLSFGQNTIVVGSKCAVNGKLMGWFSAAKMQYEDAFLDIETVQSQEKNHLQPQDSQQIDLIELSHSIIHYPYVEFPAKLIQDYHQNPSKDQPIKDIIAFRCLKNISQPQLSLAIQILDPFMTNFKKVNPNQYDTGRQIFTAYFQKHRQRLEKGYKEGTFEDKIKYLIVLNNYKLNNSTAERVEQISESELLAWDRSGLGVAYYSQVLIKSSLPYQHLLKVIQQRLKDESEETARDRIRIVEVLLSIPDFQHCYPKQIIETGLAVLSKNIELVSNLQMLQILRFIYEQNSKQSIKLTQKMMKYLSEINLREEPSRVKMFVPLVLKTLKYAQVVEIETEPIFLQFLGKQEAFAPLFKQFSKLYFHTLLFLWSKASESQVLKQKRKEHIIECLKTYKTVPASRKDQLIKLFTLLSNHEDMLKNEEKSQAKSGLLTIMSQSQDRDVHYKCLHFLIRDNDSFFQSKENQQKVSKYLQIYFQSSCVRNNLDQLQIKSHLDENIHLAYLLTINKFTIVKSLPHIQGYDFSKQEMIGQQTFQRLIVYLNISSKFVDLHEVFSNLQPFALYYLDRKRLSYRTIITLLQLGAKMNYDRKYLYKRIEKTIFQILVEYANFTIKMQDLHLIKNAMLKRNLGSPFFRELILRSIQRHGEWKAHKKRYIESQSKYWNVPISDKDEYDTQSFK